MRFVSAVVGSAIVTTLGGVDSQSYGQFVEQGVQVHLNIAGANAGDQFGWVARSVGDINTDGCDDFAVGAPTNDDLGADGGKVYVYSGKTGALLFAGAGPTGSWFGYNVGTIGDVTGDGVADVFSSGVFFGGAGAVRIYNGATGVLTYQIVGEASGDLFGHSVTALGDLTGDGVADFAVGAPRHDTAGANAGRVYLLDCADGSEICIIDGDTPGDEFGSGLAMGGDLDGDGLLELMISAQRAGASGTGLAYVYNLGATCVRRLTLVPGATAVSMGQFFVDMTGDVDGDGIGDIYAGDFNASRAYVWSGATGALIWTRSSGLGEGYGIGTGIGDLDGDSREDFVIGAYTSSIGASQAGRAYVVSGAGPTTLRTFTYKTAGANLGFDCAGVGDADGDGVTDYIITAASEASARGRVFIIRGQIPPGPADLNGDWVVSGNDMALLLAFWGNPGDSDLNGDNTTDGADLAILLANWTY
jgi:hypothetical protein